MTPARDTGTPLEERLRTTGHGGVGSEPVHGKGPAARAVFAFLVRYPGFVDAGGCRRSGSGCC